LGDVGEPESPPALLPPVLSVRAFAHSLGGRAGQAKNLTTPPTVDAKSRPADWVVDLLSCQISVESEPIVNRQLQNVSSVDGIAEFGAEFSFEPVTDTPTEASDST
jgi:hypothetical protein